MDRPFVSATCGGERCRCGKPAVKKVGEEIPFDDPTPDRHNLTAYVCAEHYAELMGPLGAKQCGATRTVSPSPEQLSERLRRTEKRNSFYATNRTAPIIESEYDALINPDGPEAADALESAQAEIARLTTALAKIRRCFVSIPDHEDANVRCGNYAFVITAAIQTIDAALKDSPNVG
jgi:hypothetical protein